MTGAYWGIRLDQNQDLRNNDQYPDNPVTYQNTSGDTRLFDPVAGNNTFNGRNRNQYIKFEDYDGDARDDTPADVHYEAGMGCIDCHGSFDLHGGSVTDDKIQSRMSHGVAIQCEDCHGGVGGYAPTVSGLDYGGSPAQLAVDSKGNTLRHVAKDANGNYYLTSRLTGQRHFIPQTMDTVVNSGKINPDTLQQVYTPQASYAMGHADGNVATGIGPQQAGMPLNGFSHTTNMSCASCHSSWTNTCMGCHLEGEYRGGNEFSNITGEEIVFRERNAEFVYQSPVFFQLGVGPSNKIEQMSPNSKVFFKYRDRQGNFSDVFAFTDRNGEGNDPGSVHPSLGHNAMMAHSIRGRVEPTNEGPRYCVACHLTTDGLNTFGQTNYSNFKNDMANNVYTNLNFNQLRDQIGMNPGNELNSPLFVHAVAGLGSGLFLFDADGCPVNPLDDNNNRAGCALPVPLSPQARFNINNVAFNLDRIVTPLGVPLGSSNHPMLNPNPFPNLRDNSPNPGMAGPLGASLVRRLTDPSVGIVLDSWIDASRINRGNAPTYVK